MTQYPTQIPFPLDGTNRMPPKTDSPSPPKKRRTEIRPANRGIDFFFKKQLQRTKAPKTEDNGVDGNRLFARDEEDELRRRRQQEEEDEELARQLQDIEDNYEAADAESAKGLSAEDAVPERDEANGTPNASATTAKPPREDKIRFTNLELSSANSASTLEDIYAIPLDKEPLQFNPVTDASTASTWSTGRTPYAFLTHAFILINSTRSRLKIVDCLVNTLRVVTYHDPTSLLPLVWLTTNAIAPPFEGIELNLGGAVISKALKNVSGLTQGALKGLYDKWGDIGDVAFEAKMAVRTLVAPQPLTVRGVYSTLREIARAKGTGSGETKRRLVEKLLVSAKGEEVRYIGRTLVQHVTSQFTSPSAFLGVF